MEISSLLLSYMFSGSNSECQTWQVLLPVEPKIHWPRILHFLHTFCLCVTVGGGECLSECMLFQHVHAVSPTLDPPGLLQMVVSPQCVMRKSSQCS